MSAVDSGAARRSHPSLYRSCDEAESTCGERGRGGGRGGERERAGGRGGLGWGLGLRDGIGWGLWGSCSGRSYQVVPCLTCARLCWGGGW